jgi:PadR family transcriptional regulator, regulatory protein PadR
MRLSRNGVSLIENAGTSGDFKLYFGKGNLILSLSHGCCNVAMTRIDLGSERNGLLMTPVWTNLDKTSRGCFFLPHPDLFIIIEQMKTGHHLSDFELIAMLVLLRLGEDAYGVPIAREIEEQTKREVKLGSVYAALERLEEKGFVASELGQPTQERGGRAKRYFRITQQGMREVRETRRTLIRLWQGIPELNGGHL